MSAKLEMSFVAKTRRKRLVASGAPNCKYMNRGKPMEVHVYVQEREGFSNFLGNALENGVQSPPTLC